ncbi:hypothetical protein, partial [Antarctobacter sp.]|uniref:hypothetical protein n=1 Tax=Antarctobacter sp. TaxID=1872577 RepID=UPI002B2669B1
RKNQQLYTYPNTKAPTSKHSRGLLSVQSYTKIHIQILVSECKSAGFGAFARCVEPTFLPAFEHPVARMRIAVPTSLAHLGRSPRGSLRMATWQGCRVAHVSIDAIDLMRDRSFATSLGIRLVMIHAPREVTKKAALPVVGKTQPTFPDQ